ncbi:MAG: Ppx/GppA family phosphatase [Nitrospirae bacterium]|nr:MAG: Ppx/GppA family phosphatase [Nitrospirota bacterium]
MSLLASIDVGSNTIRLLIGKIENKKIVRQRCEMAITRLASGINETGLLNDKNMKRSVSALKEFARLISEYKVTHVKAVGTSALREAKNSEEFVKRVLSETGIKIDVILGHEEAGLTATGVLFDAPKADSSFIIDLGGGSAEWVLCKNSSPVELGTIPTGVVKLFENNIKSDPPSSGEMALLKKEVDIVLKGLKARIGNSIAVNTLFIGTAGAVTTLAAIDLELEKYNHEKVHRHKISLKRLYEISEKLLSLPLSERRKIRGLEPERADLIIPGIVFTIKIMELFGFKGMLVSDNGLLEGALISLSAGDSQGGDKH